MINIEPMDVSHHWVKIEVTRVHVLACEDDAEPAVILDPEGVKTQYGCDRCDASLSSTTLNTECHPVDIQHPAT